MALFNKFIHQEDRTNLNVRAPNNIVSKLRKQKLTELKGEIGISIIVRDFNMFHHQ